MSGGYSIFSDQVLDPCNKINIDLHNTVTFTEAKRLWQSRPLGLVVPHYCKMGLSPSLEWIYPQSTHLGQNSDPTLWYTFSLGFFNYHYLLEAHNCGWAASFWCWLVDGIATKHTLLCPWGGWRTQHTLLLGCFIPQILTSIFSAASLALCKYWNFPCWRAASLCYCCYLITLISKERYNIYSMRKTMLCSRTSGLAEQQFSWQDHAFC